jgi:6-phosphogluconolactonase/glucosamine-6-phosphate isomerase/deaminase
MKAAQPNQKAAAMLQCLRCGQPGHFAANCPIKSKGSKRRATESMARHDENAMVTFVDKTGTERLDVALLEPGASAFLCGYGPMFRYIKHLEQRGFPIKQILDLQV